MDKERIRIIMPGYARAALILIAIYLIINGVILGKELLVPIAFGALFSTLLLPVAVFLEKAKFIGRMSSSVMAVLLAIVIFASLIFGLYRQVILFIADVPLYTERLFGLLNQVQVFINEVTPFMINLDVESVKKAAIDFVQDNFQSLTNIIFSIVGSITVFILIPIYIFLFLYYRDFLQEFIVKLYKKNSMEYIRGMTIKIQQVSKSYVGGMFLVSLILSIINTIVLWILGVDHAVFFGFFAGFLNIIPYIGPIVGSILPITFALLTKDTIWVSVAVFIYFYVVQLIESYIFIPAIVGKHVNMNPLIVILALFVGYYIWGIVGMVLIVPVTAILKRVFDEVESLEAFGFLIGGVPDNKEDKKKAFFKNIKKRIHKEK
ncbi:MAG: AI-2E family transporter [Bacteroidetes bacterium]|nr:AI-2E family transporter [Bacteroidota bacterium]